jgi:hypothetical protein
LYDNLKKFLEKMKVSFVVDKDHKNMIYCEFDLDDTIGSLMRRESSGARCDALNIFYNLIKNLVLYINNNSQKGCLTNGTIEYTDIGYSTSRQKIFNFQARIKTSSTDFQKSYKACNSDTTLSIGGSKSRRTRRRKHSRKSHHKHARKTHHKRAPKSHKRKRHSRAARKHKKHTSRR